MFFDDDDDDDVKHDCSQYGCNHPKVMNEWTDRCHKWWWWWWWCLELRCWKRWVISRLNSEWCIATSNLQTFSWIVMAMSKCATLASAVTWWTRWQRRKLERKATWRSVAMLYTGLLLSVLTAAFWLYTQDTIRNGFYANSGVKIEIRRRSPRLGARPMLGWLKTLQPQPIFVVVIGAINMWSTAIHCEVLYSNRFDTTTATYLRRIEAC